VKFKLFKKILDCYFPYRHGGHLVDFVFVHVLNMIYYSSLYKSLDETDNTLNYIQLRLFICILLCICISVLLAPH